MYTSNPVAIASLLLLTYLLYHILQTYWRLRFVPGPFWARFTNLQRVLWVKSRRAHEIHMNLHEKYGDCVRFGPNMVSISDPAAIATVYPMRPGFPKVRVFYDLNCRDIESIYVLLTDVFGL